MSREQSTQPKPPELAKHDASVLDLAFAMDCTGSMGSYIQAATQSIKSICEEIVSMEKSDIKLALVEYRDHPPQDETFVTRVHDFTDSITQMKSWLEECSAIGGGDAPEAVADALDDSLKLSWRENSTKILVLVSDAPPHGLETNGDSFPNGCPKLHDPMAIVKKMGEKGITLYVVGCEPSLLPYKNFFAGLAYSTGGQYVPLRNAKLLSKVIVGGAVEEISLEKLMEDVNLEVEELQRQGIRDESVITEHVQLALKSKGKTTNQLRLNSSNLESATEVAKGYSKMSNMADIRAAYAKEAPPASHFNRSSFYGGVRMESSIAAPDMYSMKSTASDSYTVEKDFINVEQSERLVKKALNRKKK